MNQQMTTQKDVAIYCLNYKNPRRGEQMRRRFDTIGKECVLSSGVGFDDPRIDPAWSTQEKKNASNVFGHLDNIRHFLEQTDKAFGIFAEDDAVPHRRLAEWLPSVIDEVIAQEIDTLLLGYLIPYKLDSFPEQCGELRRIVTANDEAFAFYEYPDDVWGSQMTLLSRKHAEYLLENATRFSPFAADWILTKKGKRALVYPPLAIEDNEHTTWEHHECDSQFNFHKHCFQAHYDPETYVL
jgi:hypothetical protein